MKILLIGNGGREHAIAEAIKRSKHTPELIVFATKKNPGITKLSTSYHIAKDLSDFEALKVFVGHEKPDLAFVGPDNPIADGAADLLELLGVPTVAPKKVVARIESSKSFTRDLTTKYKIPGSPLFKNFSSMNGAKEFLHELGEGNYVVKADGLMFGKGVKVAGDHLHSFDEALKFCEECLKACGGFVIEEKLVGVEFSLMSFTDGMTLADMPAVQDYKRAFEDDQGPNTGGMGTYSDANHSLPFLTQKDLEDAHAISEKILKALHEETGEYYQGILYGGFMVTRDGVKLIEYNARFGDPESLNVLSILETDFIDICQAIITMKLKEVEMKFAAKATVCKYLVPLGYPDAPQGNMELEIGDTGKAILYYGSVNEEHDKIFTGTSRNIGVVGVADSLDEAEKISEAGCQAIKGSIFHRKDIGTKASIQTRIDLMQRLR